MSIKVQGQSLTLVKGHSDFKVKCLTFACILRWVIQGLLVLLFLDIIWNLECLTTIIHQRNSAFIWNIVSGWAITICQCLLCIVHHASSTICFKWQSPLKPLGLGPWYLIFSIAYRTSTKFVQMVALGSKVALEWGVLGLKIKIHKNLLLQNCLAQLLEIWSVAWPDTPLPSLFKPRYVALHA